MKRPSPESFPHIAVLVPASSGWGRGVIAGIAAFANRNGPWYLQVESEGEKRPLPRGWKGDGIIARLSSLSIANSILGVGAPVVNVSGITLPGTVERVPRVCNNLRTSGAMAARYFLDRGFRSFAYVGPGKLAYVREHRNAFKSSLPRTNRSFASYGLSAAVQPDGQCDRLVSWLRRLPKPVAILTWNNAQARALVDACRHSRLLVPEDVAILSGDDDTLLCGSCLPRLSAISVAAEQIGEAAAALLHRIIRGRALPATPISVNPLGIITRQSTDTLAISDPIVVKAMAFIREHACEGIQVDDVIKSLPLSRRTLEREFQQVLARSPAEEIRRVRVERAKELLASSDLAIPRVAAACGFGTGEYMATVFRQATGMTPLKFRAAALRR